MTPDHQQLLTLRREIGEQIRDGCAALLELADEVAAQHARLGHEAPAAAVRAFEIEPGEICAARAWLRLNPVGQPERSRFIQRYAGEIAASATTIAGAGLAGPCADQQSPGMPHYSVYRPCAGASWTAK